MRKVALVRKMFYFVFCTLTVSIQGGTQSVSELDLLNSKGLLISDVNYINVTSGQAINDKDILISDGIITKIEDHIPVTEGVVQLDATGKWLIPGLIDAHIHFFQSGGLYTRPDAIDLTAIRPYSQEIQWLKNHTSEILKSYLKVGITTVVDVGGPMYNYKIRENFQNKKGYPNIFVTGPLISTYQPNALNSSDPPIMKANTAEEARELVRVQLPHNPDFIKIWYIVTPLQSAEDTYEIIKATIDESHSHGLKVAVHATQLHTAKLAVRAGADVLVHSVSNPIDEEFIKMLLEEEVVYIPTLIVHGNYNLTFADALTIDHKEIDVVSPEIIGSLLDVKHLDHPRILESIIYRNNLLERDKLSDQIRKTNLKILNDAGIIIGTGTDAGNIGTLHAASYYREIEAMKAAGLTNAEIIQASTIGAAHVIGQQDSLGQIGLGMKGDLIILDANPLDDLDALNQVREVIKNGIITEKNDNSFQSSEELAQRQLNAYNLRNIDAFLEPYSDSVRVYSFPDELIYIGKEKMRTTYSTLFNRTPDLHCQLLNRVVIGNTVVDHEHVSGFSDGGELFAIAIYKIRNGKIAEVYFDRGQ